MRRGLLLLAGLLAAGAFAPARAQDASVQADVDARKVGLEDQLQLTLTVSGASAELAEEPVLPPLTNLRAVAGPFVSNQFSWVNGRASQSKSYTWTLQPEAAGSAQVGAMRVKLAGGEKNTAPIAIEIVQGSLRPQRRQRAVDPFGGADPFDDFFGRRRGPRQEPKLRVEAVASRTRLHVGEPLLVTYYVDTTVSLSDVQFKEPPQYAGFWAEDLERPEGPPDGRPVTIEGQEYRRFPLMRRLLFPTRAGALSVPAVTLRLGLARQSMFDTGGVAERTTQPLTITAEAIPTAPDFSGAVGRFRVTASLDKDTLAFGEAATLRFRVEGNGNLKWVEHGPEVALPGAKVYPPQVKSALKAGADGLSGTKTWEYVVVPETAGTLEVPALPFAFFDPQAGRIEELRTAPLALHVGMAGAGAAAPGGAPADAPARVARTGTGLALRSDLDPAGPLVAPLPPGRLALLVGLMLAAHGALLAGTRLVDRRRLAAGRSASSRGVRHALHDLRRAGRGGLAKEAAVALIEKALHETFGEVADGAGERERAARAVLQDVQFIRYAPQLGDYSEKIRDVAARAEQVVRRWA